MFKDLPPEIKNALPGIAGSALAMLFGLAFARRPPLVAGAMFAGGVLISFFLSEPLAIMVDQHRMTGTIGFLLGTFGMALVAKVYDAMNAIDPADLWGAVRDAVRSRLGAGGKDENTK